jgi:hypothetical protein
VDALHDFGPMQPIQWRTLHSILLRQKTHPHRHRDRDIAIKYSYSRSWKPGCSRSFSSISASQASKNSCEVISPRLTYLEVRSWPSGSSHRFDSRTNISWWSAMTVAKIFFQSGFSAFASSKTRSASRSQYLGSSSVVLRIKDSVSASLRRSSSVSGQE